MQGKVSVITGANAGLGLATTRALAEKGSEVVMVCRSPERGEAACRAVIDHTGNERVHLLIADLASQADVRAAGRTIRERWPRLDVLINNAATLQSTRKVTEDGLEMQLAVNHLAPFLLTHLLLPALALAPEGRIVNVGSNNHRRARIYFDDLQLNRNYQVLRAYGQTKLANLLFTYELDRRLRTKNIEHITVNCADPGLNDTAIGNKGTNFFHSLAWRLRRFQGKKPEDGAGTQIYLAASEEVSGLSGKYWVNRQTRLSSPSSYREQDARRLWQLSQQLCGIEGYLEGV